MKSIKTKILTAILGLVIISLLITGFVSIINNYSSTINILKNVSLETAKVAANRVSVELTGYKNLVSEFAREDIMVNEAIPLSKKINEFRKFEDAYNFDTVSATDKNGITIDGKVDLSQTPHFIYCKQNNAPYITEPSKRVDNGTLGIMIVAPIQKNGEFNGMVVAAMNAQFLSDIVSSINIGKNGSAQMLNKNGNIIAHSDQQKVVDKFSNIEKAKTDKSYSDIATLETQQINKQMGTGEYEVDGVKKILAYAPIANTDGWSIGVNTIKKEFAVYALRGIIIIIIVTILTIIISTALAFKIANNISNPIKIVTNRLVSLSNGDINSDLQKIDSKDETGKLNQSLQKTILFLRASVTEISKSLGQLSDGNINLNITNEYYGDFKPIKTSMLNIINSYNDMIHSIKDASEKVDSGSKQIAQAAQALAIGATEQSSSVEELVATVNEVTEHTNKNAEVAREVSNISIESTETVNKGNEYMQNLLNAMNEINNQSNEISNIIKVIDEIASQTSLLSLNASIEAARAGEAGKGFAVVATEIGKLANQSQQAAKNTAKLIQNSVNAVKEGSDLADQTGEILESIVKTSTKTTERVNNIADACEHQAISLNEILQGIQQISTVVETNSATAQQTSASSEELSAQSELLAHTLDKFNLKN